MVSKAYRKCLLLTEKMKRFIFVVFVIVILIVITFALPIPKELDFYFYHVWECQQAHAYNMTFLVCSGFWVEPTDADFENPCAIHPLEDPYEEIAHGSNLGSTVIVYGILGYLTTDTIIYPPIEKMEVKLHE